MNEDKKVKKIFFYFTTSLFPKQLVCIKSQPNVLLVFIKFNIRQNIMNFLFKTIPKEVRIHFFEHLFASI
jgi:hypothetical protein